MLSSFLLLLLRNSSFFFFMCKPVLHTAADLRKPSPHTTVVYLNLLQLRSKKSDYQPQQQYHLHQQRQISFSSLLQDLTTLCNVFDSHELFLLRHDDRIQGTSLILRFLLLQLVVLVVVVVLFRCILLDAFVASHSLSVLSLFRLLVFSRLPWLLPLPFPPKSFSL
jgi:hypothetical protein